MMTLEELEHSLYIAPLHAKTHIWSAKTMMAFLEFYAGELRERRRQLKLTLKDRALLLCDQATQHSSKKFEALKLAWMSQHNVEPWCQPNKQTFYVYILLDSSRV